MGSPFAAPAPARPEQICDEQIARRMSAGARPLGLGAWREVTRTGTIAEDPDPDRTAAALVRRWHQHLAVAVDLPMERYGPGAERLPALIAEWLDLARRTTAVRRHVAVTGGPRSAAEAARQRTLLTGLLADDLAALGAPEPLGPAAELLHEVETVAAAEDAAGRVLPAARAAVLRAAHLPEPTAADRWLLCRLVERIAARLHLAPAS